MNKFRHNKVLVSLVALLTLPVSLPYYVIKTVRRKTRKARALQQIDAADRHEAPQNALASGQDATPLLSVIMPVYNIEKYLEASIISVLNQSYRNIELIIVNDASTDGSLAVVKVFEKMDDRVRIIDLPHNTVGGAGIPSNIGLEEARGEFIAFFDGDDLLSPHIFEKMMRRATRTGCDLTIGSFKNLFDDTKEIEKPYDVSTFSQIPSDVVLSPEDHPKSLLISAVPWRKIYKKSFLDAHKIRFPEGDLFYEDNPLHWDVMTAAKSMIFVPVTVVYHRMNRHGQTVGSGAPKLAAHFQHFTAISQRIRKNSGDFAWESFLRFIDRAHWIVNSQTNPALVNQFLLRFNQVVQEHAKPFLSKKHQSALKRVGYRFETEGAAPDLSAILYYDGKREHARALNNSIASVRNLKGRDVEILLLHKGMAPETLPEWGPVITIEASANAARSYNQAIQLCAGRYLVFLQAGDEVSPNAFRNSLSSDQTDVDLLRYIPTGAQQSPGADTTLYGRRLVQDNALFFGPTLDGAFSFDVLCTLYAKTVQELAEDPIKRRREVCHATTILEIEKEAAHLVRQLCAAPLDPQEVKNTLASVSAYFKKSEANMLDTREATRLAVVRTQASDKITQAQHMFNRKSAADQSVKDLSGV